MKRIMALIAVLILLSTACAESYPAYVWGDDGTSFALLLDADGTILTPVDQYAMIYPITDDGDERALFCAAILDEHFTSGIRNYTIDGGAFHVK